MRKHWATTDDSKISRGVADRLFSRLCTEGVEHLIVTGADELRALGVDPEAVLPGTKSAVTLAITLPQEADTDAARFGAQYQMDSLGYDLAREIETLGFRSIVSAEHIAIPDVVTTATATDAILAAHQDLNGRVVLATTVLTRMSLASHRRGPAGDTVKPDWGDATSDLATQLSSLAREFGADLTGATTAARLNTIADQLRPVYDGEEILDAADRSIRFTPWDPEITTHQTRVRTPEDHLPGAQSVFVFGLRMHEEVLRWATKPPAEAAGPYSFETYVTNYVGWPIAVRLIKQLEAWGYKARLVTDVTGIDSLTANPRGPQPDLFSNRFAGVAAGMGYLATSGHLATPQFGIRQRVFAIVTDAPLWPSDLYQPEATEDRCSTCGAKCITACPSHAFTGKRVEFTVEGQTFGYQRVDAKRCDWVKRYALMGEGGFQYLGSPVSVAPEETVTANALEDALKLHDPIKKYRPVIVEPCVIRCPLACAD